MAALIPFGRNALAERQVNSTDSPMSIAPLQMQSGISPSKAMNFARASLIKPLQQTLRDEAVEEAGLFPAPLDEHSQHSHVIICPRSAALLLGRAKNHESDNVPTASAAEAIGGSVPVQRAALPSNARHVSRDHAIVFHTPFGGSAWAVKILGQNGLIVNGKRRRAGLTLKIVPGETVLDFFGVSCMFVGDDVLDAAAVGDESALLRPQALQDGRSPVKQVKEVEVQIAEKENVAPSKAIVETPLPPTAKKYVGNMAKRPQGAPFSPPTSSPAPRDHTRPSSPVHSFPGTLTQDHESEEEDEAASLRGTSPTLQRRSGKGHDDSGVLIPGGRDSEDEASQALPALSRIAHRPQIATLKRREASNSGEDALEISPFATPRRASAGPREPKRVKFLPGSTPAQGASTGRTTSAAIPLETMQAIQAHYRSLVSTLASTYDLQGLLAGVIVFHRTATISATEAVRSVLSSTPGLLRGEVGPEGETSAPRGQILAGWSRDDLLEDGMIQEQEADNERVDTWQRKAWREMLESCLIEGECFGIIQRAGKDASGNPLECWYYYDKEHDPDAQRAANLGAFAKPMRAALKSHKPIFWRKSAYGNNADDAGTGSSIGSGSGATLTTTASGIARSNEQQSLATESQWGSAGNALSSLVLTGSSAATSKSAAKAPGRPSAENVVAASGAWEETQYEENESTWDKEGDMDFDASGAIPRRTQGRKRK